MVPGVDGSILIANVAIPASQAVDEYSSPLLGVLFGLIFNSGTFGRFGRACSASQGGFIAFRWR